MKSPSYECCVVIIMLFVIVLGGVCIMLLECSDGVCFMSLYEDVCFMLYN